MEETEVPSCQGSQGNSMGQGQDAGVWGKKLHLRQPGGDWSLITWLLCQDGGHALGMLCVDVMGSQCEG